MDAFRATYEHVIRPVNSEEYWKKTGLLAPEPPTIKRPPGRPTKKKKKPDPVEDSPDATKGRRTFMVTCQKCGQTGHNAKTCKGPPRPKPPPKVKKNGQPTATKNTSFAPPSQDEVQVSQTAPQPLPQEQITNNSSHVAPPSTFRPLRPKQPIRRPHSTLAPTPPSAPAPSPRLTISAAPQRPTQSASPKTLAATSYGTASRIFKFMPTPGLRLPK
ncbi:hypothetical protein Ahy_A04g020138 [Arachis hypogaea]|uniref:CCHC-type domain-containing protein n=1 Tax=Arachis hypogaea TaxID=3818 RepID=A0A445DH29_ARAHY|nr:hypothetical protein Ahy_A04g020138 [Arachis hypogaea]